MQVTFFLPERYFPDASAREAWQQGKNAAEQSGKSASVLSWIYQTWQILHQAGQDVRLSHTMPDQGVVVALTGNLASDFRPPAGVYLLGIVADGMFHAGADRQILQNSAFARWHPEFEFMPHWPQPGLLPRDGERGDRFENIRFFGDAPNLSSEIMAPTFQKKLAALDLGFSCVSAEHWHDYRSTDCALAIRSFDHHPHHRKPASKLYNAWLSEVPFIGGWDSAYAADGIPETNYLRCGSPEAVLRELCALRNHPARRHALVEAGRKAAESFTREAITRRWVGLLEKSKERFGKQMPPVLRKSRQAMRQLSFMVINRISR